MKELTQEAKKAVDDKSPLIGHLRFQPQGYPRDAWRMSNVAHPSTWDREHWSYRKPRKTKRPSKAARLSPLAQAQKLLEKLTKGMK